MLLFIAGIGANLARGHKPDCRCFGQLYSAPAGWKTLARNGVLAAIAGFVIWEGRDSTRPGALSWLEALSAAQSLSLIGGLVVLGLLAGLWWVLFNLLRQNGRLLVRLEALEARPAAGGTAQFQDGTQSAPGLPVGAKAPAFNLSDLPGKTHTLDSLCAASKPVLLIFTTPDCGLCDALLPEVGRW